MTIRAPGIDLSANLKDDSLSGLIKLIQENRDATTSQQATTTTQLPTHSTEVNTGSRPGIGTLTSHDNEQNIKAWLQNRGAAELLNLLKWDSFPEKILLLGAWNEAKDGNSPWRSADMDELFKQAKEKSPGNFPRDIKNAIRAGLIHAETPRTYSVTRTGWNKIGQAVEALGS